MGTLSADHTDFRDTVTDLRDAVSRLTACRDRGARSVDGLLGTWRGSAATGYAEGWAEWRDGAELVLDGLATMAVLLDAVSADLACVDDASSSSLDRLSARLG